MLSLFDTKERLHKEYVVEYNNTIREVSNAYDSGKRGLDHSKRVNEIHNELLNLGETEEEIEQATGISKTNFDKCIRVASLSSDLIRRGIEDLHQQERARSILEDSGIKVADNSLPQKNVIAIQRVDQLPLPAKEKREYLERVIEDPANVFSANRSQERYTSVANCFVKAGCKNVLILFANDKTLFNHGTLKTETALLHEAGIKVTAINQSRTIVKSLQEHGIEAIEDNAFLYPVESESRHFDGVFINGKDNDSIHPEFITAIFRKFHPKMICAVFMDPFANMDLIRRILATQYGSPPLHLFNEFLSLHKIRTKERLQEKVLNEVIYEDRDSEGLKSYIVRII